MKRGDRGHSAIGKDESVVVLKVIEPTVDSRGHKRIYYYFSQRDRRDIRTSTEEYFKVIYELELR